MPRQSFRHLRDFHHSLETFFCNHGHFQGDTAMDKESLTGILMALSTLREILSDFPSKGDIDLLLTTDPRRHRLVRRHIKVGRKQ